MNRLRFLVGALLVALPTAACGGSEAAPPSTATSTIDAATAAEDLLAGSWFGTVPAGARVQLRLETDGDGVLTGVFDSVDEGVMGLPLESMTVSGRDLAFSIERTEISGSFVYEAAEDRLVGSLEAGGEAQEVVLTRRSEPFAFDRPQHPEPPYPYAEVDVSFPGGNGDYELAGTLTVPNGAGPFPTVLLITGSGAQDRDEQLAGHRPFLVIADHLTRAGIVVLRYDDPGVGASGGSLDGTTADLAEDAGAAFRYLKGRPETALAGMIGHSEGGLIAPIVAAAEEGVAFAVLMAGPSTPGAVVLAEQSALIMAAEVADPTIAQWQVALTEDAIAAALSDLDAGALETELERIAAAAVATVPASLAGTVSAESIALGLTPYADPWMRYFLRYDPAPALGALDFPVLALFGSVDLQVPAGSNAGPMRDLLTHPASEVEVVEGVNHLFQESRTGRPSEYVELTQTISPPVLERISTWILSVAG